MSRAGFRAGQAPRLNEYAGTDQIDFTYRFLAER